MGYIKQPEGVDFFIKSEPFTDEARQEISAFIRNYKKGTTDKKTKAVATAKDRKVVHRSTI